MNIKSCLSLQVDQDNFLLFLSLHNHYFHQETGLSESYEVDGWVVKV